MKKLLLALTLLLSSIAINAQTFTNTVGGAIPDNGVYANYPITVAGLASTLNTTSFGLESVTINITHPNDGDLRIKLQSPTGAVWVLTSYYGGTGDNYTATIFNDTAHTLISAGVAPFTGYYHSVDGLFNFNSGVSGNGVWNLMVRDQTVGNVGTVVSWSLKFSASPAGSVPFSSSNLPIVILNTVGNAAIPDSPDLGAWMKIIYNGVGVRNYVTDFPNNYNDSIGIQQRGSSSASFPQKQYGLTTKDIHGVQLDTEMLGMPAQHDWILYAPYDDKTCMRNVLTYNIGNEMGHWAARTQFCELILNGNYQGIYVFMEKIKRDHNRVSIAKLDSTGTAGDSLTGGYIIKIDKTTGTYTGGWNSSHLSSTGINIFYQYDYPNGSTMLPIQKTYIQQYVDSFENALAGPNFMDTTLGYRHYIGTGTFIDYFLVNEISKNVDGYRLSSYFNKDKQSHNGGKLHAGPIWDYNLGWWNANYCNGDLSTGWAYQFNSVCGTDGYQVPFWWDRFMQDSSYTAQLKCRWLQLRQTTLSIATLYNYIDSMAAYINEAQVRHFQRWPILGVYTWPNPTPLATTFAGEISNMKNWIAARMTWLDANMPGTCAVPNPAMTASGNNICPGDSIQFTDVSTSTVDSRVWSFPGGTPATSTNNNPFVTYTSPGIYSVMLTVTNAVGTNSITYTNYVHVVAPPTVTVTSPSLCAGASATLTASGASTYTWSAGATSSGVNTATVTPSSTTTYTVTGTDGTTGCKNTSTATVTVNPLPAVNAGTSVSVCNAPVATTLTGYSPAGGTWSGTGVTAGGDFTPPSVGNFVLTYTYTDGVTGCTNQDTMVATVVNSAVVNAGTGFNVCSAAAPVTLTGSPASGGTWTGTGVTGSSFNPSVGVGNYILTYSYGSGTCANSDTIMVSVTSGPSVTVNSPTVCAGQPATLTASGAASYSWSTSATTNSITVSPTTSTTYTVTGNSGGCATPVTATVTVNPLPVVNAGADIVLCNQPIATALTGYSPSGGTWTGTGVTPGGSFTPPGIGVFPLTYTFTNVVTGCVNSDVMNATVVNSAVADAGPHQTVCQHDAPFTLTGYPAVGGTWGGPGISGNTFDPSVAGPGSIVVSYYYGTGVCFSVDSTIINVIAAPAVTVNSPAICAGSSATLTATGASSYLWSTSDVTPSITVSPAATAPYTVTGTDAATGCSTTVTSTVTVSSLPDVSNASSPITICSGESVAFAPASSLAGTSFTWTNTSASAGLSGMSASGAANITDVLVNTGATAGTATYSIVPTGAATSYCIGTAATLTVNVNPNPATPTITQVGTVFTSSSATGNQWYLNGAPIAGAITQNYTATVNGDYTVMVTNAATGCVSDSAAAVNLTTVGVNTSDENASVQIYPNPSQGAFTVDVQGNKLKPISIKVYDIVGQIIYETETHSSKTIVNLATQKAGLYFVQVTTETGTVTHKVVKE
jgi:subtilisin-like proprotein convertase family protein/PKD repeat protein